MNIKNYFILMNEFNEAEKKELFSEFSKSEDIMTFKSVFGEIIGKRTRFLFFDSERRLLCRRKRQDMCIVNLLKNIKPVLTKKTHIFNCRCSKTCISIPMIEQDGLQGYLLLGHLKQMPNKKDVIFMEFFIDITLKNIQKEKELKKLYDTIRPRAIALSTIHTIHRLLTSTLDMNELIERIARLTLQVMRAKRCFIMLLDESKSYLIPKALIDFKNHRGEVKKKSRKIKIGATIAGKVAKSGRTSLSRNSICVPLVEEEIIGVICANNKINRTPFNKFDIEILSTLAEQAVIAIKNAELYEEQEKMAYGSIKSLAALLDAKSPHTYTHSEEFVKMVLAIAEEMKLSRREETRYLRYAAFLPDTGKFSIPDEILRKRGGLSGEEYAIIKRRHLEGLKILEPLEFLKPAMPIIMYHHERYDGSGYPDGLKGEEIPIGARIMAVADAFEAMVSSRPYKDNKISISQALKEIKGNKGTQFDPKVVDALIKVSKKPDFKKMF